MGGEGKWYPKELQSSGPFVWSAQAILYAKHLSMSDVQTEKLRKIVSFAPKSILITSLNEPDEKIEQKGDVQQQGSQLLFREVKTTSPKQTRLSRYIPPSGTQQGMIAINFEAIEDISSQQTRSIERSKEFFSKYAEIVQQVLQQELAVAYMNELTAHADQYPEIRRASKELLTSSATALTFLVAQSLNMAESLGGHHQAEKYLLTTGLTVAFHGILSTILNVYPFIEKHRHPQNLSANKEVDYIQQRMQAFGILDTFLPTEFVRTFIRPYYSAKNFDATFIKPNKNQLSRE